jgi:tetratricopeptide (TPR) repeat protein
VSRRKVEPAPSAEIPPAEAAGVQLRGVRLKPGYAAAAAAALASVVAVVWLVATPQQSRSIGPDGASAAAPSAERSASASPGRNSPQFAGGASGAKSESDLVPSVEATVYQLKDAGNWNVLVLYAAKWTRDEPNNATAWNELSNGYANLRQFNDALGAATKAAELSPADARLWRNLGHLNVTLERLPEAGSAFDRALALSADDADALCGAAGVAHRLGRTKDADEIAKRAKAVDASCPGTGDGDSVAVAVGTGAARRSASSVAR